MKKMAPGKKLLLSRETLSALDPNLIRAAGASGNSHTCTSMTSAVSVCYGGTNPLCE